MMDRARKAALSALDSIFSDNSYSNITLDNLLSSSDLSAVDRGFVSALVYGVIERKISLDYVLSKYVKKGFKKLPVTVLNALRLALFQIIFMDKVPDSAAVNESVNLIKASEFSFSASFVNAVLRNVLRGDTSLPEGNDIFSLSRRYSCAEYIIKDLISDYGIETAKQYLSDSLKPSSVFLKVNTVKTNPDSLISLLKEEGITAEKCDTENALKVIGLIDVRSSKCFKSGLFHIEDLACQKAISVIKAKKGERILDMCSAPGGKSFSMAEDMENSGEIVSCDIYKSRTALIKSGAERLGLDIIKPAVCDSSRYKDENLFDAVLCDVPCSGYGVIGRKPEIKYKPQTDFNNLEEIQFNILSNADKNLKSGGRILYSTCTLRKAENSGVVSRFLDKHPDYKLKYEHTFMPHIDGTDGFYCALMIKSR